MSKHFFTFAIIAVFALASIPCFSQLPAGSRGNPQHNAGGGLFGALSNVMDANAFAGSDFCVQVSAAITALGSAGTVDARGVSSTSCSSTLSIPSNITVLLPAGAVTFNGNPGIKITGPGVTLRGAGLWVSGSAQTILQSNPLATPPYYALIENQDTSIHQNTSADNLIIEDLDLNGNNKGSFGVFLPSSFNLNMRNVHVHQFTAAGILCLGGDNSLHDVVVDHSGLDGVVWGFDGNIDGLSSSGRTQTEAAGTSLLEVLCIRES